MPKTKIGVFDSGVGGLSVANAIRAELPGAEVVLKEDKAHLPYGTKTADEIHSLVKPIFQQFIDEDCQVIVVACNTVTTNLISRLREEFPVPMIGMEPMVKPAAERTKSKIIAVLATPRTLSSERYRELKDKYARGIKIIEPDVSNWAMMIENNSVERDKVAEIIEGSIVAGADEIVLGCTHYHWIEEMINKVAEGRAEVIQPERPIIERLKRVIEQTS